MTYTVVGEPLQSDIPGRNERAAILVALFLLAAAIRSEIAYNGGIWADEGFFTLVVGAPSWHAMLDFLRVHESHPPFFYALVRVWTAIAGSGDTVALALPVIIGAAMIPAIYDAGRRLFSERTGLIAATLATISPPLVEHSAQLRPYGLLPLLALASCTSLIIAVTHGKRGGWVMYALSTIVLLYTQNWAWLIAVGQLVAVVALLVANVDDIPKVARNWTLAWVAIGVCFLPWLPTLLFQARHAGHEPVIAPNIGSWLELVIVGVPAGLVTVVLGTAPSKFVLGAATFGNAAATSAALFWLRTRGGRPAHVADMSPLREGAALRVEQVATRVLLIVSAVAIVLAIALSARTNMRLARCMVTVSPFLLLIFASWIDRQWGNAGEKESMDTGAATLLVAVLALSFVLATAGLVSTPRSNVKDVIANIQRNLRPNDLVILAPEWYAASFNHYFHRPVEQIDYPYPGVSGMIDFSNVFQRVSDPLPLLRMRRTIKEAARDERRVWFISSRDYARDLTNRDVEDATNYRVASAFSVIRVHQLQSALHDAYGAPDTASFVHEYQPRYDELVAYLYSPRILPSAAIAPSTRR